MDTWTSHERVPFHLLNSSFPAGTCENLTTGHAVSWHPFLAHTNHLTSFSSLVGEMELGCESLRDKTSRPHPSGSHCSLSLIQGSGPPRLALSQDLLSRCHAMMQTQPPEVPWGQIFTFPRLQNTSHLMADCVLPCPAELSYVVTCIAHREYCTQFKYALPSIIFSSSRWTTKQQKTAISKVSSGFSLYWGKWCPERRNQKQQPPAASFSEVHGNRRQHKTETTTW